MSVSTRVLPTPRRITRARRGVASTAVLTLLSSLALSGVLVAPSTPALATTGLLSGPAASLRTGLQPAVRVAPPRPSTPSVPSDVQAVLDITNAERAARGVAPLTLHPQLSQAAEAHARDQFRRDCLTQLSHIGTDGSNPGVRIARTGLQVRTWGENIACGQTSASSVMRAWMNSSGHRANILDPKFTHLGVSASRDSDGRPYWVQVFGTPR